MPDFSDALTALRKEEDKYRDLLKQGVVELASARDLVKNKQNWKEVWQKKLAEIQDAMRVLREAEKSKDSPEED